MDDIDDFATRDLDRYNMMDYAMKYFRVPKGYDTTMKRGSMFNKFYKEI